MAFEGIERPYTDEAAPYIEEFGGKIGGLEYLRDKCPNLRPQILPSAIIKPCETFNGKLPPSESGKYIVRGSHPLDIMHLVDVIPTYFPEKEEEITETIERIRQEAKEKAVMVYGKYEDPSYDGNVVVAVQPRLMQFSVPFTEDRYGRLDYAPGCEVLRRRGSIVDHPDNPGNYVTSHVLDDPTFSRSGLSVQPFIAFDDQRTDPESKSLIRTHKEISDSGLIPPGYSFQVEFMEKNYNSGESPYICQVRVFRKKQPSDGTNKSSVLDFYGDGRLVFGTTPPEGVVLPVFHYVEDVTEYIPFPGSEHPDSDRRIKKEVFRKMRKWRQLDDHEPWALLKTCNYQRTPLSFMPQRLHTFFACNVLGSGHGSLDHHNFHLAQKASVAVIDHDPDYGALRQLLLRTLKKGETLDIRQPNPWDFERRIIRNIRLRIIAAAGKATITLEK